MTVSSVGLSTSVKVVFSTPNVTVPRPVIVSNVNDPALCGSSVSV